MRLSVLVFLLESCGWQSEPEPRPAPDAGPIDAGAIDAAPDETPPDAAPDAPDCDADGDGHRALGCGGTDCDDGTADVHPGVPEQESFERELVDDEPGSGEQVDLAAGVDGRLHVVYSGPDPILGQSLRAATHDGVGWRGEILGRSGGGLWWPAIAVAPSGDAHAIWGFGGLSHATEDAGEWETDTVDTGGGTREYGAIAVDGDGVAHATYRALVEERSEIRHASNAAGVWEVELVDDQGRVGGTSIAIGEDGTLHVAYIRAKEEDDLVYARRDGGGWTIETVEDGSVESALQDIVVDRAGRARITFTTSSLNLYVATRDADAWTFEQIAREHLVHWDVSSALDPTGALHVVYQEQGDYRLELAREQDGDWVVEEIDATGERGRWNAIAFDTTGALHVAYSDEIAEQLHHAWRSAPNGRDDDCDGVAW